jgi:DtxR family transcriptional regulator, Mn-dependent transcriptional regulator
LAERSLLDLTDPGRDTIESSVRITISKENYLKAIAEAESEGECVKAVTLSRWLQVSAPAVTMAIKRLKRDNLIQVDEGSQITLTPAGREIATRLLNRHHLIERMLTEIFGLEWYKVHEEAEALEHAVSADFECKLAERLGGGTVCPHGNLAMDSPRARRRRGLKPLEEVHGRECVQVASVFERDRAFLEFLDRMGIRPGVHLAVVAVDQDIAIETGSETVRLERTAAAKVWVTTA